MSTQIDDVRQRIVAALVQERHSAHLRSLLELHAEAGAILVPLAERIAVLEHTVRCPRCGAAMEPEHEQEKSDG